MPKTEASEQIDFLYWASRYSIPQGKLGQYIFSIPNEGARSRSHGARMKAQGLRSGMPDLMLALPLHGLPGLFIEMKREGGKLTDNQRKWLDRLDNAGYAVAVAHGCEQAKQIVTTYLEGDV